MCNFCLLHSIRDLVFIGISIAVIIFCFNAKSAIVVLESLPIRTNFTSVNSDENWLINYLESEFESNETNKYTEFFKKYNLSPEQTLDDNEDIKYIYNNLYNICFATAIISIILFAPSFMVWGMFCCCENDEEGFMLECLGKIAIFTMKIRVIILFILLSVFLGFFVSYKVKFENDFFDFYNDIKNNKEQTEFKEYYNALFELKFDLLINIILQPINIFIMVWIVIIYYDPCACIWKNRLNL